MAASQSIVQGSGKNIIARRLAEWLKEMGREVPENLQRVIDSDAALIPEIEDESQIDQPYNGRSEPYHRH
jgi:hypothetical protein